MQSAERWFPSNPAVRPLIGQYIEELAEDHHALMHEIQVQHRRFADAVLSRTQRERNGWSMKDEVPRLLSNVETYSALGEWSDYALGFVPETAFQSPSLFHAHRASEASPAKGPVERSHGLSEVVRFFHS